MFSVTDNCKIPLKFKENAIFGLYCNGPTFGSGHDLALYDKADTSNSSYANLGQSYQHHEYIRGSR